MAAELTAAIYYRIGFSIYVAVYARRVRVPGGIKFHLAPGTIDSVVCNGVKIVVVDVA